MHTKKMTTKKCRALGIYCVLRRSPFTTLANSANYTQMMRWSGGGGGRTGGATGREGGIRGGGCAAVAAAVWASYVIVLSVQVFRTGPRPQTGGTGMPLAGHGGARSNIVSWEFNVEEAEGDGEAAAANNIRALLTDFPLSCRHSTAPSSLDGPRSSPSLPSF